MTSLPATPPAEYLATRGALHRVAVHVCARRRFDAVGRLGLRPTPGGFGTPAFGAHDGEEVLRVAGSALVREQRAADGTHTSACRLEGASLAELAEFADTELDPAFSVGRETPDLGAVDAPLEVDGAAAALLGIWYHLGALALDAVLTDAHDSAAPSVVQLWPEHFDLACDLEAGKSRVNLGVSPGDPFVDVPYAYVGPWSDHRPGDPGYWNASFGALLPYGEVSAARDPVAAITEFFALGLAMLSG